MTDETLRTLLASKRALLLDFDGPVTALMPAPTNFQIAESIREVLRSEGALPLPQDVETTSDPLAVLRFAATLDAAMESAAERACRDGELAAAGEAVPTDGVRQLLDACAASARPVVIVSNNFGKAIQSFLDRHGLADSVSGIIARPAGHPELMKPNPHLVNAALDALALDANDCVLFGDSVSDVTAANAAGVQCVGFGKNPKRAEELRDAGATVVVDTLHELATAMR